MIAGSTEPCRRWCLNEWLPVTIPPAPHLDSNILHSRTRPEAETLRTSAGFSLSPSGRVKVALWKHNRLFLEAAREFVWFWRRRAVWPKWRLLSLNDWIKIKPSDWMFTLDERKRKKTNWFVFSTRSRLFSLETKSRGDVLMCFDVATINSKYWKLPLLWLVWRLCHRGILKDLWLQVNNQTITKKHKQRNTKQPQRDH